MRRSFAIPALALVGAAGAQGSAMAQEIRRTELGRSPVSGDDIRKIIMQLVEFPPPFRRSETSEGDA